MHSEKAIILFISYKCFLLLGFHQSWNYFCPCPVFEDKSSSTAIIYTLLLWSYCWSWSANYQYITRSPRNRWQNIAHWRRLQVGRLLLICLLSVNAENNTSIIPLFKHVKSCCLQMHTYITFNTSLPSDLLLQWNFELYL